MTWIGAPTIYYGDEAGLVGGADPDDRRTFPWNSADTGLQAYYHTVIGIRNAHPALRDGAVSPLVLDDKTRVFGFLRKDSSERVAVVFNGGPKAQKVRLKGLGTAAWVDALTGKRYTPKKGALTVPVPPVGAAILTGSSQEEM